MKSAKSARKYDLLKPLYCYTFKLEKSLNPLNFKYLYYQEMIAHIQLIQPNEKRKLTL